eukprot:g3965.t1
MLDVNSPCVNARQVESKVLPCSMQRPPHPWPTGAPPLASAYRDVDEVRNAAVKDSLDKRDFIDGTVPNWSKDSVMRMKGMLEHLISWTYYHIQRDEDHPQRKEVGEFLDPKNLPVALRSGAARFRFWRDLRPPFQVVQVTRSSDALGKWRDVDQQDTKLHPDGELFYVTYVCPLAHHVERAWNLKSDAGTFDNKVHGIASEGKTENVVEEKKLGDTAEKEEPSPEEREPNTIILLWLCCVSALEGMDTQLVPACQFALQRDLGLQLGHFAVLTTVQMVLTNLAAPFWGILADRGTLQKKTILMLGAIGEGIAVTVFAFVPNFWVMMFLRGMSGFFLASLRPVCNGLIADLTSDNKRGKIFGRVQSALLIGMFCSLLIAGNVANTFVGEIPGWRFLFAGAGLVAFIVAAGLAGFLKEPPHELDQSAKAKGCAAVRTELCTVLSFLRIPTFCVMIMQGVFGTIPWSVMGNNLLFFKFCGHLGEPPCHVGAVGRLDLETTGLIVMTDDRKMNYAITSTPLEKTYELTVAGRWTLADPRIKLLSEPYRYMRNRTNRGEEVWTLPAEVRLLQHWHVDPGHGKPHFLGHRSLLELTLREGRHRQIRRLVSRSGLKLLQLHRTSLGPLRLASLAPGLARSVTSEELFALRKLLKLEEHLENPGLIRKAVRIPLDYPEKSRCIITSWGSPVVNWNPNDDKDPVVEHPSAVDPMHWMPIADELQERPTIKRFAACRQETRRSRRSERVRWVLGVLSGVKNEAGK